MSKQAVPGLDIARFAAALLVAIYHLCYWRNGFIPADTDYWNSVWRFGWIGVQIFFTISGYVIAFSAENSLPNQFAKSRFLRLVPTVWICATLTFVAMLWDGNPDYDDLIKRYFSTLFLKLSGGHIDIVYWTLTIEVSFYLFVFLGLRFFNFHWVIKTMFFIGLLSSLFNIIVALDLANGTHNFAFFDLFQAAYQKHTFRLLLAHHGCFFALGILIWTQKNQYRPKYWRTIFLALIIGTIANVWIETYNHHLHFPIEKYDLATAPEMWLASLAILLFACNQQINEYLIKSRSLYRTLGLMTFPLYLLHNNFGLIILHYLEGILMNRWYAFFATLFVCFAASYLVFNTLEPRLSGLLKRLLHSASKTYELLIARRSKSDK